MLKACFKLFPNLETITMEMSSSDFQLTEMLQKSFTNHQTDINKMKINWLNMREIVSKKAQPYLVYFRGNFFQDESKVVDIHKKQVGRPFAIFFHPS